MSSPQAVWISLSFSLGVFLIFPFVLDVETETLRTLFSSLLWVSLFFTLFLTVEGFYSTDYVQQIFHHLHTQKKSILLMIFTKVGLQSGFILLLHFLLLPIIVLLYQVDFRLLIYTLPYLAIGAVTLSLSVHFAHILILALNQRGMFALLVLLPLIVPVLIFGSSACHLTLSGEEVGAAFYYLFSIFLLTLGVLPYTSSLILTEALKQ